MQPTARVRNVAVQSVGEEVVLYDAQQDRIHRLNPTLAAVWRHCDGRSTVPEIAAQVATDLEVPVDEQIVWMALDQLDRLKLLETRLGRAADERALTRRHAIALSVTGLATLLLPGCESMKAPTASLDDPSLLSLKEDRIGIQSCSGGCTPANGECVNTGCSGNKCGCQTFEGTSVNGTATFACGCQENPTPASSKGQCDAPTFTDVKSPRTGRIERRYSCAASPNCTGTCSLLKTEAGAVFCRCI